MRLWFWIFGLWMRVSSSWFEGGLRD